MNVGISTACLYPMETEKALKLLCEKDFKLFEIFFNTISELKPEFLHKLKETAEESGSRIKSIHPFTSGYESYLLFTNYERRFEDTVEFYKNYFNAANILGAEILVIHGDKKTSKTGGISDEEYYDKFARLSQVGKSFGVTLAQENVNAFRSQNPHFLKKMREYLGDTAKFVLDIKQAVRSGNDPFEVCEAMGEGMVHLHINDHNSKHDCMLPGAGTTDYCKLFEMMKKNCYKGDAVIEVYRGNFKNAENLVASRNFINTIPR